jgi:hypothetical protein
LLVGDAAIQRCDAARPMSRALDPSIVDEEAKGRADKATFMATRLKNAF